MFQYGGERDTFQKKYIEKFERLDDKVMSIIYEYTF